jgi:glycosyltransferase involved in cell wall biosynthesis
VGGKLRDNNVFPVSPEEARVAREKDHVEVDLDPSRRTSFFVGKLQSYRRPLDLIDALKHLGRRVHMIMIGGGPLTVENASLHRGIPNGRFLGLVSHSRLPQLYAAADIFVLPSKSEAWALDINESTAAGVAPATTTDCGAADDLAEPSGGRIHRPGDIGRLSSILRAFADQRDEVEDRRIRTREGADQLSIGETALAVEKAVFGPPAACPVRPCSTSADCG